MKVLKNNPEDIIELQRLAFSQMQGGKFQDAIDTINRAIKIHPQEAILYNHLGNVYRKIKRDNLAEENYKKALSIDSNYAEAYNNYGLLLYQQKKYSEAEKHFIKALKLKTDYLTAMYNLALSLEAQQKIQEAISCLMALIEVDKKHLHAHFLLGKFLLNKKLFVDADKHFFLIADLYSNNPDILLNITNAWLNEKNYLGAKNYCKKFLNLEPKNIEMLYNLGVIETRLNNFPAAIAAYEKVLQENSTHFPALYNIAILYLEQRRIKSAEFYFKKALELQPENETLKYMLSAISGDVTIPEAPFCYIKELFNGYADHFDKHLEEDLQYRIPDILFSLLKSSNTKKKIKNTLDLGCGTGLMGKLLRNISEHLIGVDMSENMLKLAKEKNYYNELHCMDNLTFLQNCRQMFDLIIAADVFVYKGDLQEIFKACRKALKPNGLFAFSVEDYPKKHFSIQPSGRFAHSKSYIENLSTRCDFKLLACKQDIIRKQYGDEIRGNCFIFTVCNQPGSL